MSLPLKFTLPTVNSLYFNTDNGGGIQILLIEITEANFLGVTDRWH